MRVFLDTNVIISALVFGDGRGPNEALLRRDPKDVPVLRDALKANADVLLTGDKDFLATDIERPVVFSPAMMWDFLRDRGAV